MKKIRCGIYTRKSSEEGLDQEFNSLHAQREACAAYIASQKHEGWVLLADHYDDGGISGGTLERDGLKRLLAAVDEGQVDQIVVYKIDRLTRSLADFAKLVERLDGAGASFVSVTQSFNTATSMGRLTLNVLLSFAQFEREVTAERIRDKILASKKKGMWMGGHVPLGYEANGRTLRIVEKEAATVRTIYDLYREHGSVTTVTREANRLGLRSKARPDHKAGKAIGRGHIHAILTNPVYAGRIRHKDQVYAGQHRPIVEPGDWETVQVQLKGDERRPRRSSAEAERTTRTPANASLLLGKLFDETGDVLTPSHANKKGRRYRYYVSNRLIAGDTSANGSPTSDGWRLPARALEELLTQAVQDHVRNILMSLQNATITEMEIAHRRLNELSELPPADTLWLDCIARADLQQGSIRIRLDRDEAASRLGLDLSEATDDEITFTVPFAIRRRGVEAKLIIGGKQSATVDQTLIDNLARARACREAVKAGQSLMQVAGQQRVSTGRIKQLLRMAFLAPDIVSDIMRGDHPPALTSEWLQRNAIPDIWSEQRRLVDQLR